MKNRTKMLFELKSVLHNYNGKGKAKAALEIESLHINGDAVTAFIGPNASGKTTLTKILAHLVQPTTGRALFKGEPITTAQARRFFIDESVAYVEQFPYLYKSSVLENVKLPLNFRGYKSAEAKDKALEALGIFDVQHLAKKAAPTELSGGEMKKVALARAFAIEPKIILLDEPFTNLDEAGTEKLNDVLMLYKEQGASIIVSAPEINGLTDFVDETIRLENGRIVL